MEQKKITLITTVQAPTAIGPYSQATSAGNFLFLSGQLGLDPQTMQMVDGIEGQTHQAVKNCVAILAQANKTLQDVVKTTIFLKSMADFPTVNIIYANYFASHLPARSCVAVAELPKNGLIEIELIAT